MEVSISHGTYIDRPPWTAEVSILHGTYIDRPPWTAEVSILQEQQIDPYILSIKKPRTLANPGSSIGSLTMTYSHMGKPHTTIGDEPFHV